MNHLFTSTLFFKPDSKEINGFIQFLSFSSRLPDQYSDGDLCKPCHSTCGTCDGPTEHACLTCSHPLILQGTRCVAECDKGSFDDKNKHSCTPCVHTCAQCVSKSNCSECIPGLQVSKRVRTTLRSHRVYWIGIFLVTKWGVHNDLLKRILQWSRELYAMLYQLRNV